MCKKTSLIFLSLLSLSLIGCNLTKRSQDQFAGGANPACVNKCAANRNSCLAYCSRSTTDVARCTKDCEDAYKECYRGCGGAVIEQNKWSVGIR